MSNLKILLYPDELPYSGIARLLDHHLLPQSTAFKAIFQSGQRQLHFHFATGLSAMANVFVDQTADTLLTSHTLFPLFAQFRNAVQRKVIAKALQSSDIGFQFVKAKHLKPFEFKFCPECARSDRQQFGETYWHREHQIPFVTVCTNHKCLLETWVPPVEKLATRTIFSAKNVQSGRGRKEGVNRKVIELANSMVSGLEENREVPSLLGVAQRKGFVRTMSGKNFLSSRALRGFFSYSADLDSYIHDEIKRRRVEITMILNGNWRGSRPVLYYLLRQYLATLPDVSEPSLPNLSCINSICPFHGNNATTTVMGVKLQYRKEDGFEVECNECGMIYRSYLSKSKRNPIIAFYGGMIKAEIVKSQKQGETFKDLSKRLSIGARVLSRIHEGKMKVTRRAKQAIDREMLQKRRSVWLTVQVRVAYSKLGY